MSEHDTTYDPQFKREYRLYAFCNYYLSSIQQGIQTGHAAVDLVRKYTAKEYNLELQKMVEEWADNHKTFVTLNGGNNADLQRVLELVEGGGYPFVTFHEDEQSLGGIMTTVAVVLPDDVFNLRRSLNVRDEPIYSWTRQLDDGGSIHYLVRQEDPEFAFVDMLKSKGLAK